MILSEMRTLTRIFLDDRNSERWTDTEITSALNGAQEEVQKLVDDADEMYFSSGQNYNVISNAGSYEFSLPTDCRKVILAERLGTGDPIPARWTTLARRHLEHTSNVYSINATASPLVYLRGNKLGVVKPDGSYTLRVWYTKRLPDLSAVSDTSEIPAEYHRLMCLWGAKILCGSEEREFSEDLEEELQALIVRMTAHMEQRQRQEPRYVHTNQWE